MSVSGILTYFTAFFQSDSMSSILQQELLKLVWVNKLYTPQNLKTREGHSVVVIHHGQINPASGPDILGAQVEIDGIQYSGPIAIHVNASHWRQQLHHIDMEYDNCILHVVQHDDATVCRVQDGQPIPTVTISYPKTLDAIYHQLTEGDHGHMLCGHLLRSMESVNRYHLLTRLMIERLERKYHDFLTLYAQGGNNWNEAFYITLFIAIGTGKNKEAFTKLAQRVTYTNLCRVKESLISVEGLLLGAAGLLNTEQTGRFPDAYTVRLQEEGDHLCRRFGIQPMQAREWETLKCRPGNHPVIRIAELASLLCSKEFLFSRLIDCTTPDEIRQILCAETSEYWFTHHLPSRRSDFSVKRIGGMTQNSLIINLVVPMMFTYGKTNGNEQLQERALEILEKVEAERNEYIKSWSQAGIVVENAFFSQALIQLSKEYCLKKRCASCNLGKIILCSQEKALSLSDIL